MRLVSVSMNPENRSYCVCTAYYLVISGDLFIMPNNLIYKADVVGQRYKMLYSKIEEIKDEAVLNDIISYRKL